ncbi:MAG: hypothetical protein Q4F30_04630 [Akkermansia sp.]|nr:hypothetical protein [Akkermansia sp.]
MAKRKGTEDEIAASRSSVLDADVTLGGGTLQVLDQASLTVKNLTAKENSAIKVSGKGSSLTITGDASVDLLTVTDGGHPEHERQLFPACGKRVDRERSHRYRYQQPGDG